MPLWCGGHVRIFLLLCLPSLLTRSKPLFVLHFTGNKWLPTLNILWRVSDVHLFHCSPQCVGGLCLPNTVSPLIVMSYFWLYIFMCQRRLRGGLVMPLNQLTTVIYYWCILSILRNRHFKDPKSSTAIMQI